MNLEWNKEEKEAEAAKQAEEDEKKRIEEMSHFDQYQ